MHKAKKDRKRKQEQLLNGIIKHVNAIFLECLWSGKTARDWVELFLRSLNQCLDGALPRPLGAWSRSTESRCGPWSPPAYPTVVPECPVILLGGVRLHYDTWLLDDQEAPSPPPYVFSSISFQDRRGAEFRWIDVCGGGGCTVETSCLLGGEVRQEDWVAEDQGLYGVSHSLVSRCRPERRGWGLNVSGKVECVALQFGEGDGRMLQVVEQYLNLRWEKTSYYMSSWMSVHLQVPPVFL